MQTTSLKNTVMATTSIEWTQMTWNPSTGCTKVSAGCKHCYAEVMAKRLQAMGLDKYRDGFKVRMHPDQLQLPYTWKTPKRVFVNSMSDLFHEDIPLSFIQQVFAVMNDNPRHVFQVLTKRSARLAAVHQEVRWTDNIWMGVSVEDDKVVDRIDDLRQTGARIKFLSCEPLLGPLPALNLQGIDWLIAGGESGRRPRPMSPEWVISLRDQCKEAALPFFFKQWGGVNKKAAGRILNGNTYDEMPMCC